MLHKYFLNRCIVVTIGKPTDRARCWAAVWQPKPQVCHMPEPETIQCELSPVSLPLSMTPPIQCC